MQRKPLPLSKKIAYAVGQLGWATLVNIVSLQLIYFYRPPEDAGIPYFITQTVFFVVLNAITLIAASGRLLDAVTDPLIANWSDKFKSPKGRRMPFLKMGAFPTALFCVLMFVPISSGISSLNILWLVLVQALFYISLTIYVTPYFALLPEFGHTPKERLDLSTYISITYALGIILASLVPAIADGLMGSMKLSSRVTAIQYGVGVMAFIAMLLMWVPTWFIHEPDYSKGEPSAIPFKQAIRRPFQNKHFIYYVVADFAYFLGLTITMTGLLYYITVLLELKESMMAALLPALVFVSFLFYPLVNFLAKKVGKKILISGAFFYLVVVYGGIFFLGNLPMANETQAWILTLSLAIPYSFLGILPNAVLADIADKDARDSGINQEGMFFAARTLMQKFGQTFGVVIFAMLTIFGKDIGDDFGIRLSGLIGAGMCFLAGVYFLKYDEAEVLN